MGEAPHKFVRVEFGCYTDSVTRKLSVLEITNQKTFDELGHPTSCGLYDRKLGMYDLEMGRLILSANDSLCVYVKLGWVMDILLFVLNTFFQAVAVVVVLFFLATSSITPDIHLFATYNIISLLIKQRRGTTSNCDLNCGPQLKLKLLLFVVLLCRI